MIIFLLLVIYIYNLTSMCGDENYFDTPKRQTQRFRLLLLFIIIIFFLLE